MTQSHDEYMADLVAEFLDDAEDSLAEAVNFTLALKDGYDRDAVDEIYRMLHSLKGHSAILGFFALKTIAHGMESAFEKHRREVEPVSAGQLDVCLRGYDAIACILGRIRGGEPETASDGEFDDVVAELNKLV